MTADLFDYLSSHLAGLAWWGASCAAVTSFLWVLFTHIENSEVVSSEGRRLTTAWLMRAMPEKRIARWASSFAGAFDAVFGQRHLTWKCAWRSAIATVVSMTIVFLIAGAVVPDAMAVALKAASIAGLASVCVSVLVNIGIDYLSLLQTRKIITWMSRATSLSRRLMLLVADVALTACILTFSLLLLFWATFTIRFTDGMESVRWTLFPSSLVAQSQRVTVRGPGGILMVGPEGVRRAFIFEYDDKQVLRGHEGDYRESKIFVTESGRLRPPKSFHQTMALYGDVAHSFTSLSSAKEVVRILLSGDVLQRHVEQANILQISKQARSSAHFENAITPSVWYSTFFTSIWLWLYTAAGLLVQLSTTGSVLGPALKRFLNVEEKPFLSIGAVMIILSTIAHIMALPIVLAR